MARALLVAYYFPPLGGIGSHRALGHARYLPEYGWDVDVLAPRTAAHAHDESLCFPERRVVRTRSLELSRLGKKVLRTGGDDWTPANVSGARRAIQRTARAAVYFPDAQVGWTPYALQAGRRLLRRRPVDAIVSSSFPITAHVIARRLARDAGVPWVAEFRDPWSEMLSPGCVRRRAARLERSLARDASALVMPSQSWARRHAHIWDRPVDVIPNGHDLSAPIRGTRPAATVLGYLGTYYPATQASLAAVWHAVGRGDCAGPAGVREIRIVGELNPIMRSELQANGLIDRTRVTGLLPHAQALQELSTCSIALVAGPAVADGILQGQVAGKVWEYLGTDLPIIYVGPRQCDVARLLAVHDGVHLVAPGDAAMARTALRAAVDAKHPRDAAVFSRRARAGELARVLDRVSGGPSISVSRPA